MSELDDLEDLIFRHDGDPVKPKRGARIGSTRPEKDYCVNGHKMTPENTILRKAKKKTKTGKPVVSRVCRACRLASNRAYKDRSRTK